MKKVTTLVLMLCLVLSGALCHVHGVAKTSNEKDWVPIPIDITESTGASGSDRSSSIVPVIHGHVLSVTFTENFGHGKTQFGMYDNSDRTVLQLFPKDLVNKMNWMNFGYLRNVHMP